MAVIYSENDNRLCKAYDCPNADKPHILTEDCKRYFQSKNGVPCIKFGEKMFKKFGWVK